MANATELPPNLFGVVPESFFADLGRVAMLAALLDQRLHDLYVQMYQVDQRTKAGHPGTHLVGLCRSRLVVFAPEQRDDVTAFLDECLVALDKRNAVLHTLWSFESPNIHYGWRYPKAAGAGGVPAEQDADQVPRLIEDLVALNHEAMATTALVRQNFTE